MITVGNAVKPAMPKGGQLALSEVVQDRFAGGFTRDRPSMRTRRMLWSLLTIAAGGYAGLCLVFFVFQRSFIYMPTPATPAHTAAFTLEVPGGTVRVSTRPHDGPKALVFFGGNAENVASTMPELADAFPDRAIYGMHYRGYSGSSGHPSETDLPPLNGTASRERIWGWSKPRDATNATRKEGTG